MTTMTPSATSATPIDTVCIIGLGLIGGSLALALKQAGWARRIIGAGRHLKTLQQSLKTGLVDQVTDDYTKAVAEADLVVVSVPLGAMAEVFRQIKPALKTTAVVTDAGSAKASVVAAVQQVYGQVPAWFVPGHPIAGSERSGAEAAKADLYQRHRVILTPLPQTDPQAIHVVTEMWQAAGAFTETLTVEQHDRVLAATSHLPHIIAYSLVDSLAELDSVSKIFRYAAGGFKDFTRIASSDPVMWRDICLHNRDAVLAVLQRFDDDLQQLRQAIQQSEAETLLDTFSHAKQVRDRFIHCADEAD